MTTTNDREWAFLAEETGKPDPFNDMYFRYLRGLGYTGTLQDMIAKNGGGLTPSKGTIFYEPDWAPPSIRKLKPVFAAKYTEAGKEFPDADSFISSTVRRLRDYNDPLTLNNFSANTPRQDSRGRYINGATVERLVPNGDNPLSGLGATNNVSITAAPDNPHGSYTSALLATGATTSINAMGRTSAFSGTIGDTLTAEFLFSWGTSGRLRARLSSTAGNSTVTLIKGSTFAYPDSVNGTIVPEIVSLGNDLFLLICRVVLTTTQADFRWNFGPNLATAGVNITLHGYNCSRTPHPVQLVTSVTTASADLQTRDITDENLSSHVGKFILTGWAMGVSKAVIWQADDGTENNRITQFVDTSTLELKTEFVISGSVVYTTNALKTIALGQPFTTEVSWAPSNWSAQAYGANRQTSTSAGTMPTLTTLRYGKSVSGGQATLWIEDRYGFERPLSATQATEVLASIAGPFDPMLVATQTLLDVSETINGVDYIKDSFPALWTIARSTSNPQTFRFETRLGYRDIYDEENDRDYLRSELHSTPNSLIGECWFSFRTTPIEIDGALPMFLDDGVTRRPYTHINICQLKSIPDPTGLPLFAININSDGYRAYGSGGEDIAEASGNDRNDWYFQEIVPTVGKGVDWLVHYKPGGPGVGRVRVWANQTLLVDDSTGYFAYPETTNMFFKTGLYCHKNVGGIIVETGNILFNEDLSHLAPKTV